MKDTGKILNTKDNNLSADVLGFLIASTKIATPPRRSGKVGKSDLVLLKDFWLKRASLLEMS